MVTLASRTAYPPNCLRHLQGKMYFRNAKLGNISSTSVITAEARAIESQSEHKSFSDPFSCAALEYLQANSEDSYKTWKQNTINIEFIISSVICRTNFIDHAIEKAIENKQISQVVILGCGLDGRSFRMECLESCKVFELDVSDVMETRESIIKENKELKCVAKQRISITLDLCDIDWIDKLMKNGFDTKERTLWILEGVSMYLPSETIPKIMSDIANVSSSKSEVINMFVNERLFKKRTQDVKHCFNIWKSYLAEESLNELINEKWELRSLHQLDCERIQQAVSKLELKQKLKEELEIIILEINKFFLEEKTGKILFCLFEKT